MGEKKKGRTTPGEYGDVVYLDIRHLGEKKIDKKIPFVRELSKNYAGIDPVNELIPVMPVVHYMMGGIDTDISGATILPGLYAAGECACVSINGANRLGSNSLTELLVFGGRAGAAAARFAMDNSTLDLELLQLQEAQEQQRISNNFFQNQGGTERIFTLRKEMNETMDLGAGIYRSESSLVETCSKVKELRERFSNINLEDKSLNFNTELTSALELDFMLDIAEAVSHSALERKESRGSHQRSDFTSRDDENFLKHTLAFKSDTQPRIDYKDVTITKWPPGKRVYGKEE